MVGLFEGVGCVERGFCVFYCLLVNTSLAAIAWQESGKWKPVSCLQHLLKP